MFIWTFLGDQIALRSPLEAHFDHFWSLLAKWLEHFWSLLAKWLSGGPWRLILSIPGAFWPNGSQKSPGGSF